MHVSTHLEGCIVLMTPSIIGLSPMLHQRLCEPPIVKKGPGHVIEAHTHASWRIQNPQQCLAQEIGHTLIGSVFDFTNISRTAKISIHRLNIFSRRDYTFKIDPVSRNEFHFLYVYI